MAKFELETRTRDFALSVLSLTQRIRRTPASDVLVRQLVRSATSVGANYREANRAESRQDFIHKIALVEKEASETCYWIELVEASGLVQPEAAREIRSEAAELLAIFTTVGKRSKNPGVRDAEAIYVE
jgi:four helix bundle protein